MLDQYSQMDTKELEFPDTVFIRDVETRVFQAMTIKSLSAIDGIALIEGSFMDHLFGREGLERVKGIHVEQDSKNHTVSVKVELNIAYGISIPQKAEEIQTKLVKEITHLTGLHVACVHVVFKNILPDEVIDRMSQMSPTTNDAGSADDSEDDDILSDFSEEL
ncbi:MAG: hypothetical protein S4CHLAM102_15420 [Chlamydiia bacterium]|nr:hypothetical protein [Chlamydiia bacterium]